MLDEERIRALRFEVLREANAAMKLAASEYAPTVAINQQHELALARLAGMVASLSAVLEDHDLPEWDFIEAVNP